MSAAAFAMEAVRARFDAAELASIMPKPYPDVLHDLRARRAKALADACWEETPESRRETPVIRALHAFYVVVEPAAPLAPWEGELEP